MQQLDDHIAEMRELSDVLMPFNWPITSMADEEELSILKQREIWANKYRVVLYFNKSDRVSYRVETFQITGVDFPFLPFSLVWNCAVRFLGNECLSLVEAVRNEKTVYVWSVSAERNGRKFVFEPLPDKPVKRKQCVYDGIEYLVIDPDQISFF